MKKDIKIKKRKKAKIYQALLSTNFYSKGNTETVLMRWARIFIRLSRIKEFSLVFILL